MVIFLHDDEYWKDFPFNASSSRLARCSSRSLKFAQGASQAVADIKDFLSTIAPTKDHTSSYCGTPTSQSSPLVTSDGVVEAYSETIGILDKVYSRIFSVLRCARTETAYPVNVEIQMDFEEAAILSWPMLISSEFLASLEASERSRPYGCSLIILAHFYLANTLFDAWFMKGSFEGEILKIDALVSALDESQLSRLMLWPIEVMKS